jgi:hypothetical protein
MSGTATAGSGVSGRQMMLRITRGIGAAIGYGCLAAFLWLIGLQIYRWFRDGEWTHIGISDGVRAALTRCCVNAEDTGRLAALWHWLDAPVSWLGLHQVLEVVPASLALFALSIAGNSVFVYSCDLIEEIERGSSQATRMPSATSDSPAK